MLLQHKIKTLFCGSHACTYKLNQLLFRSIKIDIAELKHFSQSLKHWDVSLLSISFFADGITEHSLSRMRGKTYWSSFFLKQTLSTPLMAAHVKRRGEPGQKSLSSEGTSSTTERQTSGDTSAVLLKLLAAVFYGVSSFVIVVVNKSVLTNYR